MPQRLPKGLFITGSDTGVGKTFVGSLIVKSLRAAGYRVGVYKPVASGCVRDSSGNLHSQDALLLWHAAGCPGSLEDVCPHRFAAPLAPHLAAPAEGLSYSLHDLMAGLEVWRNGFDCVIVEGAGGLLSPITASELVVDLAAACGYPLVVVVPNRIGAINQCLQTLVAAESYRERLPVAGVVLNDTDKDESDPSRGSNAEEIRRLAKVPWLTRCRHAGTDFDPPIDWFAQCDSR